MKPLGKGLLRHVRSWHLKDASDSRSCLLMDGWMDGQMGRETERWTDRYHQIWRYRLIDKYMHGLNRHIRQTDSQSER
jgi:hypothetical protein